MLYAEDAREGGTVAHLLEVTRWKRFGTMKHGDDYTSGYWGLLDGGQSSMRRKPDVCARRMT